MSTVKIEVAEAPTTLPMRPNGRTFSRLSMSAVDDLCGCPEKFRKRRVLDYRWPKSASMAAGNVFDYCIGYWITEHNKGQAPTIEEMVRYCNSVAWPKVISDERLASMQGFVYDNGETPEVVTLTTQRAVEMYWHELAEYAKEWDFVDAQEEFRFAFSEHHQWYVTGKLDIILQHKQDRDRWRIIDTKLRGSDMKYENALASIQGPLYQYGEMLKGRRCEFAYDSLNRRAFDAGRVWKWGPLKDQFVYLKTFFVKGEEFGVGLTRHEVPYDEGLMRSAVMKLGMAATELWAYMERFGPTKLWPLLGHRDPGSWKCSAKFCEVYWECPGGGLLTASARGEQRVDDGRSAGV